MDGIVKITLNDTINRYGKEVTRNAIAVEGKIRPATISDICNGKSKSISFDTLQRIIKALNSLTGERHYIDDILTIKYK